MITFDSFTLVPTYSDIQSRSEVDLSISINNLKSELPIINANMLSVCSEQMVNKLNEFNTFSSYHRFFRSENQLKETYKKLTKKNLWASIGTKESDKNLLEFFYGQNIKNIIIDVNHGHHLNVKSMIKHILNNYKNVNIMAGNVCSTDGIKFLVDAGAHIIKVGNSGGSACTTLKATSFGVHCLHACKKYREDTYDYDTFLCADGGFRAPGDIAKSLIWANMVMLGKMFAGVTESAGNCIWDEQGRNIIGKEYFGNASLDAKVNTEDNHVKYIEGTKITVPYVGDMDIVLKGIKEGLQSAFSFVGARNIKEYQIRAEDQVLML